MNAKRSSWTRTAAIAALTVTTLTSLIAGCGSKSPTAPIVIPPLSAIVLNTDTATLRVGETLQFSVTAFDTSGANIGSVPAGWLSGDRTVFTVTSSGRVRGVGEGSAWLIAAADTVADSAWVSVGPAQDGWFVQLSSVGLEDLNGVYMQPDGRVGCAVGAAGRIFMTHDAGSSWTTQISGTAFTLNAVWFTSEADGWAVGLNGTVLKTVDGGASWERINVATNEALHDVQFTTPDDGWAVGSAGLVLHTDDGGATWDKMFPTSFTLRSVSFVGLDGWAVGDVGTILGTHDGGDSWFIVQPAVTTQPLRGVTRFSEPFAIAVGLQGVGLFTTAGPDSTNWNLTNLGASNQFEAAHWPAGLTGYAVGYNGNGLIMRTDDAGLTWETQVSNTTRRIKDVFFVDAARGWAVCEDGVILHTGTGGRP